MSLQYYGTNNLFGLGNDNWLITLSGLPNFVQSVEFLVHAFHVQVVSSVTQLYHLILQRLILFHHCGKLIL